MAWNVAISFNVEFCIILYCVLSVYKNAFRKNVLSTIFEFF